MRFIALDKFPIGLNCDEASLSYDAYSILETLSDRNGIFLPVYLLAWGSGQSALLTYISIPFIAVFGLNIWATRLPMATISSISLVVFYKIMKRVLLSNETNRLNDDNVVYKNTDELRQYKFRQIVLLFAVLFFALNPWHIMKSRWALDCNLFPDFVLFGTYFLIKFFDSNGVGKTKDLVLAFIMLSISAYSYSSAYLGLTVFCILIYAYGIKTKKISIKQILLTIFVTLFITWPLILFVIINFFDLNEIRLVFMTIPKLRINRMAEESIFGSGNVLISLLTNIFRTIKLYIFQDDKIYWNGIRGIGMYYLFSFPMFIIGVIWSRITHKYNIKETGAISINNNVGASYTSPVIVNDIFFIWLISAFILNLFFKDININRANFIIIPFIYFIIKGFKLLFNNKLLRVSSFVLLILCFSIFAFKYIDGNLKKANNIYIEGVNVSEYDCFTVGIEPVLKYVDSLDVNEINLGGTAAEPYINVLYYLKIDPQYFYKNHKLIDKKGSFNNVKSLGKWNFVFPSYLKEDNKIVYVFDISLRKRIDQTKFDIVDFDNYIVVRYKSS